MRKQQNAYKKVRKHWTKIYFFVHTMYVHIFGGLL